jgi:hypothetical protein
VSETRVRLMQKNSFVYVPKRLTQATDSDHADPIAANRLDRDSRRRPGIND